MSALLLLAALALAEPTPQKGRDDEPRCPYCLENPELMQRAGIVSHGGFEFGRGDTDSVTAFLPMVELVWLETPHFELGYALGPYKVKQSERNKIRAELTRLAEALPEINPKSTLLDSNLRAHLYAQRLEEVYTHFQQLMQVTDADFVREGVRGSFDNYMGEGPYLGQKGKYEVLMLPSQASSVMYLKDQFGLLMTLTQRWNLMERDTLSVTMHLDQGQLRQDGATHGHVAFNVAINLLDGYKHYNYDIPVWIREGLAHYIERAIDPDFNTFDSSEGAVADTSSKADWGKEVLELFRKEQMPRMAELMAIRTYAELEKSHHYATWSIVDWLVRTNPDGLACFAGEITCVTNAAGIPDAADMPDAHREAIKKCLGLSYAQLDLAWREWAEATY